MKLSKHLPTINHTHQKSCIRPYWRMVVFRSPSLLFRFVNTSKGDQTTIFITAGVISLAKYAITDSAPFSYNEESRPTNGQLLQFRNLNKGHLGVSNSHHFSFNAFPPTDRLKGALGGDMLIPPAIPWSKIWLLNTHPFQKYGCLIIWTAKRQFLSKNHVDGINLLELRRFKYLRLNDLATTFALR